MTEGRDLIRSFSDILIGIESQEKQNPEKSRGYKTARQRVESLRNKIILEDAKSDLEKSRFA